MSKYSGALALLAGQALFSEMAMYSGYREESSFHLPDIPEGERIKIHIQKFRRGKHRRNKLHDRKKK